MTSEHSSGAFSLALEVENTKSQCAIALESMLGGGEVTGIKRVFTRIRKGCMGIRSLLFDHGTMIRTECTGIRASKEKQRQAIELN